MLKRNLNIFVAAFYLALFVSIPYLHTDDKNSLFEEENCPAHLLQTSFVSFDSDGESLASDDLILLQELATCIVENYYQSDCSLSLNNRAPPFLA